MAVDTAALNRVENPGLSLFERAKDNGFLEGMSLATWTLSASAVAAVVTGVQTWQTYDGFFKEALNEWGGVAFVFLIGLNAAFTCLIAIVFRSFIRPTRSRSGHVTYAIVVALSLQSLVHVGLPMGTELLGYPDSGNTDGTTGTANLNLGVMLYDPLSKALARPMDLEVLEAVKKEMEALQAAYRDEASLKTLAANLDDELAMRPNLSSDDKSAIVQALKSAVEDTTKSVSQKVLTGGMAMYRGGRDLVKDLIDHAKA